MIPTYEEDDLVLFESGAIVFHIAERHAGLLPNNGNACRSSRTASATAWTTFQPGLVIPSGSTGRSAPEIC